MKLIGFNLFKISIERKEKIQGELKINQNIDIKDVVADKIPISDKEALKIKFKFSINYSKDIAKLEFDGMLILLPEKDELKKFQQSWKDKQLPDELRVPLFNFIMNKCNIKAIYLEDEMALPLHIQMPRISLDQSPVETGGKSD